MNRQCWQKIVCLISILQDLPWTLTTWGCPSVLLQVCNIGNKLICQRNEQCDQSWRVLRVIWATFKRTKWQNFRINRTKEYDLWKNDLLSSLWFNVYISGNYSKFYADSIKLFYSSNKAKALICLELCFALNFCHKLPQIAYQSLAITECRCSIPEAELLLWKSWWSGRFWYIQ